ncbi:hypothetical protein Rctr71_075 [Virus Rctr71]|nr:hypothetical protein Rctr71_075 [Virus Rctr71]
MAVYGTVVGRIGKIEPREVNGKKVLSISIASGFDDNTEWWGFLVFDNSGEFKRYLKWAAGDIVQASGQLEVKLGNNNMLNRNIMYGNIERVAVGDNNPSKGQGQQAPPPQQQGGWGQQPQQQAPQQGGWGQPQQQAPQQAPSPPAWGSGWSS